MIELQAATAKGISNITLRPSKPNQQEWKIGRGEDNLVISHQNTISQDHAKIVWRGDEYFLIDMGSEQGSWLNGMRLQPGREYRLQSGAQARLAAENSTVLYFKELQSTRPLVQTEPLAAQSVYWTSADLKVECYRIDRETPSTKTFWFRGAAGQEVNFNYYWPGQSALLEMEIDGQIIRHAYPISSAPQEHSLTITVERDCDDNTSKWLHDWLDVSDTLKLVGGPQGQFSCVPGLCVPQLPAKILFVSAGSGITPLMSMLRWLYVTPSVTDIIMIHTASTPEEIIFHDELRFMARMPNLQLHIAIAYSEQHSNWNGLRGDLSTDLLKQLAPDLVDRTAFVCGSEQFMQQTRLKLEALQHPSDRYFQEDCEAGIW